ncbi:MAG: diguanylate cyclase, partial [Chloroflexi bacterium]
MRAFFSRVTQILQPRAANDQDRATIRTIQFALLILFFGLSPLFIINYFWEMSGLPESVSIIMVLILLALGLVNRGYIQASVLIVAATLIGVVTYNATFGQGIHDISIVAFPGILIVTALVLEIRAILVLTIITVAAVGWLVYGEMANLARHSSINPGDPGDFFVVSLVIAISAIWVALISQQNRRNLRQAQIELSERRRFEEQMHFNAFHDHLTGLPNRALLLDRLNQLIRRRRRSPDFRVAILFMDLDGFKDINDSRGHRAGDELLVAVAQRVREILREADTVARLGGDEFVILLADLGETGEAIDVARRVQEQLMLPFVLADGNVVTSASIGIVYGDGAYAIADDMLKDADIAMYRSKALGKAQHQVFDLTMREKILARVRLQTELRGALERGEFELFYQPVVRIATGQVVGVEALLRWRHPQIGLAVPGDFLALAEENGLMLPIGGWVLRTACRQVQAWNAARPADKPLSVSINISQKQFVHPDFTG